MRSFRMVRLVRDAPVTVACLTVCCALFLVTSRPGLSLWDRLDLLHVWGAVVERPVAPQDDPDRIIMTGPVALWQGAWWRVPLCAMHHVDFLHLLMNGLSLAFLGRLVERRLGSVWLLLFLPWATLLPIIPELLIGNYVLGFSGVISALFGVICVLRLQDEELREEFPDELVYLGGAMLGIGVVFTSLGLVRIANFAHLTGFFYGALAGCITTGIPWGRWPARLVQIGVVCSGVIALWFAMHPVWNGHYHWYRALSLADDDLRLAELNKAVSLSPRETGPWRFLAGEQLRRGDTMAAWKTLLLALSHNPSDSDLLSLARRAWRIVVLSPERTQAEQTIREVFGDLAAAWLDQFRNAPEPQRPPGSGWLSAFAGADPEVRFPIEQTLDLRLADPDPRATPLLRIPPEGDAVEGRAM